MCNSHGRATLAFASKNRHFASQKRCRLDDIKHPDLFLGNHSYRFVSTQHLR